jgi:hypothetical protein
VFVARSESAAVGMAALVDRADGTAAGCGHPAVRACGLHSHSEFWKVRRRPQQRLLRKAAELDTDG